jgi:hypothetical protein
MQVKQSRDLSKKLTHNQALFRTQTHTLDAVLCRFPSAIVTAPMSLQLITQLFSVSGQWQIFLHDEEDDNVGMAVWMGHLYYNLPWVALI